MLLTFAPPAAVKRKTEPPLGATLEDSAAQAGALPGPQTGKNLVTFRFVRHGESIWNALGKAQGQVCY